jgi:hypothetical protein
LLLVTGEPLSTRIHVRDGQADIDFRFDTIKTRLQCSPPGTYTGAMDCFRKLVRNEVCHL